MAENHVGRPEKYTVDYFQHDCLPKGTLKVLEDRWKNDGYAFWYKLLETLGVSEGHILNLNEKGKLLLLSSKTWLPPKQCEEILGVLSDLEAIDPDLWENRIVWCQNFVDRISHLYIKRAQKAAPTAPDKTHIQKLILNGKKKDK